MKESTGPVGEENEQCLDRNEEVRGQVPGTTCNGACTKSAINNTQTPGYVRAPEGVEQCLGLQRHQAEAPATQYCTSRRRHNSNTPYMNGIALVNLQGYCIVYTMCIVPRLVKISHRVTVQGAPWARLAQPPGLTLHNALGTCA